MTMQNVIAFGTAISNDKALQDELTQATQGKTGQEAMAATADFASAKGYSVTTQEIAEGYAAIEKTDGNNGEELSDAEMEIVSGGKSSGSQSSTKVTSAIASVGLDDASIKKNVTGFFKGLFG